MQKEFSRSDHNGRYHAHDTGEHQALLLVNTGHAVSPTFCAPYNIAVVEAGKVAAPDTDQRSCTKTDLRPVTLFLLALTSKDHK
jgi:hypothetical protein